MVAFVGSGGVGGHGGGLYHDLALVVRQKALDRGTQLLRRRGGALPSFRVRRRPRVLRRNARLRGQR